MLSRKDLPERGYSQQVTTRHPALQRVTGEEHFALGIHYLLSSVVAVFFRTSERVPLIANLATASTRHL